MESYFVIAGAPTYQPNHYERILNLALAMMYAVRTVNVPKIDLPLLVISSCNYYKLNIMDV